MGYPAALGGCRDLTALSLSLPGLSPATGDLSQPEFKGHFSPPSSELVIIPAAVTRSFTPCASPLCEPTAFLRS